MSFFEQTKITDSSGNLVNPVQDETILLLRRMVKLLESNATVDVANRQRISLDAAPATVTVSVSNTPSTTVSSGTITVGGITANGGVDPRYQFVDTARIAYLGIRNNLLFS